MHEKHLLFNGHQMENTIERLSQGHAMAELVENRLLMCMI